MITAKLNTFFRFFFALIDLILLNALHLVLFLLLAKRLSLDERFLLIYCMCTNIIWLTSGYVSALYIFPRLTNFMAYGRKSIQALVLYIIGVMIFLFIDHYSYSRLFISMCISGFALILFLTRSFLILIDDFLGKRKTFVKRIVILGYNELSKKLVSQFVQNNERFIIEGYFEQFDRVTELSYYPILGRQEDCVSYAIKNEISEIYSTISPERNPKVYDYARQSERNMIRFKFVPDFKFFIKSNFQIEYFNEFPIISFRLEPLEDLASRIKKRVFDVVFSALMIVFLLSWLLPILAIIIKLTSKGPIFFIQDRSGKNNKHFRCIKLRTLRISPDADTMQVTANDRRITKVGRILRKTSLDELPQFLNVIAGEMSVVGPRPHMIKHTENYGNIMNDYMVRHYVKPGITGWAQVHGFRGEIKLEGQLKKRVEHDIWYIENWNIWLDLRIVLITIYRTLRGDLQAY